ncbi:hypothetical protein ACK9YZ_32915 [Rhizobium sp. ZK1]|uniref:hypothetical protein n=1 Tax=Rhizobium sp. ZK1 TaxID=3389872 RepID=UPI0039F6D24C
MYLQDRAWNFFVVISMPEGTSGFPLPTRYTGVAPDAADLRRLGFRAAAEVDQEDRSNLSSQRLSSPGDAVLYQ